MIVMGYQSNPLWPRSDFIPRIVCQGLFGAIASLCEPYVMQKNSHTKIKYSEGQHTRVVWWQWGDFCYQTTCFVIFTLPNQVRKYYQVFLTGTQNGPTRKLYNNSYMKNYHQFIMFCVFLIRGCHRWNGLLNHGHWRPQGSLLPLLITIATAVTPVVLMEITCNHRVSKKAPILLPRQPRLPKFDLSMTICLRDEDYFAMKMAYMGRPSIGKAQSIWQMHPSSVVTSQWGQWGNRGLQGVP